MSKAKVIHKDGLFVRKDKTRSSEKVRIIPCGEEFEFYEEYKGWLKVADGWVVCNDVYIQPVEVTGGGSGGVSSWNDLTDKPFDEKIELVQIYPDALTFENVGFESDTTYVVNYDGDVYECKSWVYGNTILVGNPVIYDNDDDTDTGEPFCLENNRGLIDHNGKTDSVISIHRKNIIVTPIDIKFLPESHQFYDATEWGIAFEKRNVFNGYMIDSETFTSIVLGQEYTVKWDKQVYEKLVAFDDDGYYTIGAVYEQYTDDLPFNISAPAGSNEITISCGDSYGHYVNVESFVSNCKTIDMKFLPKPIMLYVVHKEE